MPHRPDIVRLLNACIDGDETRAVRILDRMTPWRGLPEVGADIVGPPLVRSLIAHLDEAQDGLADGLEELADRLRNRR